MFVPEVHEQKKLGRLEECHRHRERHGRVHGDDGACQLGPRDGVAEPETGVRDRGEVHRIERRSAKVSGVRAVQRGVDGNKHHDDGHVCGGQFELCVHAVNPMFFSLHRANNERRKLEESPHRGAGGGSGAPQARAAERQPSRPPAAELPVPRLRQVSD